MARTEQRILKISVDLDASLLREVDAIRGRGVSRTREGVRSATDGSGLIDGVVQEYLTARRRRVLPHHEVVERARIGLSMEEALHKRARNIAYDQGISLSALLANIIASRFAPQQERAA